MIPLKNVAGIGPALAAALSSRGIATADQLAAAAPATLMEIPRLGTLRAQKLLVAARLAVGGDQTTDPAGHGQAVQVGDVTLAPPIPHEEGSADVTNAVDTTRPAYAAKVKTRAAKKAKAPKSGTKKTKAREAKIAKADAKKAEPKKKVKKTDAKKLKMTKSVGELSKEETVVKNGKSEKKVSSKVKNAAKAAKASKDKKASKPKASKKK